MGRPKVPKLSSAQVGQIAVVVADVERATAFYRDRLGLAHLFSAGDMAFFMAGGVRLMLTRPSPGFEGASSIVYFTVEDIAARHRELAEAGVAFVRPPHMVNADPSGELWMAFFEDGEGNTHALMEQRAAA